MDGYKNSEGYSDPTPGAALSNITLEEKIRESERLDKISSLIPILKMTAELVGFRIAGRITLIDIETGKKYK